MDSLFKFIAWIVSESYAVFGSYGLSIVLLTLIVMAITTPLTIKGTKSMIQMQRLQPELKKIQERHRDDREKMNQELLAFYKANNINPVGGCLPMFIQLPVFAVLYRVVNGLTQRETVIGLQTGRTAGDLRDNLALARQAIPNKSDLTFKPGYISKSSELYEALTNTTKMKSWGIDLADSASSALSKSLGHALPYLVLIAVVAVTGIIQQRQIQGRSNASSQVNSQQQAIMKIMPFFLPVISFGLPAALVVYFLVSNLWRVGQQAFITRTLYNKPHPEPVFVDTVATETTERVADTPAKPAKAASGPGAARPTMGRNRREDAPAAPAKPRSSTPARPAASGSGSGRVTPTGSGASARPAKSKKKRK